MKKFFMLLIAMVLLQCFLLAANASGTIMKVVNSEVSVSLLESGSASSSIITQVPVGAEVEYAGYAEMGYYQVVYNGMTGFISARFLTVISTPEPIVTATPIPKPTTIVGEKDGLEYQVKDDGTAKITGASEYGDVLIIPTEIDGYTVTSIGEYAFHWGYMVELELPPSVRRLDSHAFSQCDRLKSIKFSEGLDDIGSYAFFACGSLEELILPESLSSITFRAFEGCKGLKRVVFPSRMDHIGEAAFSQCESLEEIILPKGLTIIDDLTFTDCYALEHVVLSDSIYELGGFAFAKCSNLKDITFSTGLSTIKNSTFAECTSLETVVLPYGLERIEEYAFEKCTSLKKVDLPETITYMGRSLFVSCPDLTLIIRPGSAAERYAIKNNKNYEYAEYSFYIDVAGTLGERSSNGKPDTSKKRQLGNMASNIANGGFIVEGDGGIYYADGNAIWLLDEINRKKIKIIEGNFLYLNYWDGCIYAIMETKADGIVYTSRWNTHCVLENSMYEEDTYEDHVWSYTPVRITKDGQVTELAETLLANVSGIPEYKDFIIVSGSIFYLGSNNHGGSYLAGWYDDETDDYIEEAEYVYKTGISLYKMNIDGSNKVEIISDAGNYASTFSTDGEHFILLRGYENFLSMIDRDYILFDADGEHRSTFSNPSGMWDYYPISDGDDIFSIVYGGSGDDLPEIVRYSMRDGAGRYLGVYCAGCPPIIEDDGLYCFTYLEPEDLYNGEDMDPNNAAIIRTDINGQNMEVIYSGGILYQYEDEYDYGWWLNANINTAGSGIFIAELPWYSDELDAHKALYRVDKMTGNLESIFSWSEGTTSDIAFDSRRRKIESSITISGKIEIIDSIDLLVSYSAKLRPIAIPDKNFDVLSTPVAEFKYNSSDTSVAVVDSDGIITAIGEGEAIITIEDSNYGIAECVVSVQNREPINSAVLFSHSDTSYRVNAKFWCDYLLPWTQYSSRVINLPDYSLDDYNSQMKKMEAWNEELKLTPYDTTLVIMNTHGTTAVESRDIGIGFSTADKQNISYAQLKEDLAKIKGQKVVFLDSCYAGGFLESGNSKLSNDVTVEYGASITESSGIYVLTASDINETSRISSDEDESVTLFTVLLWSRFVDGQNDVDGYLEELIENKVELTLSDLYHNAITNLASSNFKEQVKTDFNSRILVWPEDSEYVVFRFGVQETNTERDMERSAINVKSYSGSVYVDFERHDYSIYDSTKSFKSYYDLPVIRGETASIKRINQLLYDEFNQYVLGVEDLMSDEYVFWEWTDSENPFCDYLDVNEGLYLWSSQRDIETGVTYDDGDIISIVISGYWMMGGVNGQPIITHTFNLLSGEEMTLNKLFDGVSEELLLSQVKSRILAVLGDYVDQYSDEFRTLSLSDIQYFISTNGELVLCLENYQLGAATSIGPVIETGLYIGNYGAETGMANTSNDNQNKEDVWVCVREQGDSVNVRTGPGLDYESIGFLQYGTYLPYLDETRVDDRGVAWFKCSYQQRTGWVSEKYCGITQ